jgi:hypothetical protein
VRLVDLPFSAVEWVAAEEELQKVRGMQLHWHGI